MIGKKQIEIPDFEKHTRFRTLKRILGLPRFAVHVARVLLKRAS